MEKSTLEELIDIESKKIIKDVFEYLGLLTHTIQFNDLIVVKREWIMDN